jgi:predicted PurR-regulated permease PerM
METLSFTLGVLSVVAVILLTVIVLGIVRVVKQQKQINSMQRELERVWENNSQLTSELHQRISQSQNDIIRSIDETRSYIDSRIDKLTSKQLLKS